MIYHDQELWEILSRQKRFITKVVIDEAHMVVLWGEDFRIDSGKLDFLRVLIPKCCAILVTLATMEPELYHGVALRLRFNLNCTIQINLGNDRLNIYMEVRTIQGRLADFDELCYIADEANTQPGFKRRIIFTNSIETTGLILRFL